MFNQLKRLFSVRQVPEGPSIAEATTPRPGASMIGLKDMVLSGWMNKEDGELMTGFPVDGNDTVLDIGCGEGGYALFSARRGASIILADMDAPKLETARQRLENQGARSVQTLVTDAAPIPLPENSVSRVVAMEVLEHVDDPQQFIAELKRVAMPGALLLLTVPDELNEGIQKKVAPPVYFERPNHIRIFKRGELADLVTEAGLVIECETQYGFYHALWWSFFWACENQSLSPPWHPLLEQWAATWATLLELPDGLRTKQALDETLPKSQVIVARKP
ncbi:class I SAM-dependent methyltransferase [Pseudomonas sp. PDM15]|uniref:class I SAM-dependent methyltransferase n=1 Tax=Pseudomonas sp. PDM15 TaxID=2769303 RepID=UPI00177BA533|nr:class I SAM-dependent methyltransferase [Pseudomonas sp. PDM15]MBD9426152.1 class I SAM-dependent methyltransferase [Pseudomonas sp. PDM15]